MEVEINKNILGYNRIYNLLGHKKAYKVAVKDMLVDSDILRFTDILRYTVKNQMLILYNNPIIFDIQDLGDNPKLIPDHKTHSYRKIINHGHFVNLNIECFYNCKIKNKYLSPLNDRDGLYIPRTLYCLILSIGIIINFSDGDIGFFVHRDSFCKVTEIPDFIYNRYQQHVIDNFIEIRDACILEKKEEDERKSNQKSKHINKRNENISDEQARLNYLRILKELSDFHNNNIILT